MNDELAFLNSQIDDYSDDIEFLRTEVFRINRYSKSIYSLMKNSSKEAIKETIEFNKYGQEIHSKIKEKEISLIEAIKLMEKKYKYLRSLNKTKDKSKKKKIHTKDIETLKTIYKTKADFDIRNFKNAETFTYENYSLLIPSEKELIDSIPEIEEDYSYYFYVSLTITGPTIFGGVTRKVPIIDTYGDINKDFYNKIKENITKVLDRVPFYEEKESEIICKKVLITLTVNKWESIDKWYKNVKSKSKKFKDFTLFLASDTSKNCVQQCVEYLGGKWNTNYSLEKMIPQQKIVTYIPLLMDIQYVQSMEDLISDFDEPNTDCKNIARLLKWNGHMGVITKIDKDVKINRIQRKRIIDVENKEVKEVFFDIESFSDETKHQIPYLICWSYLGELYYRTGKNCIKEFVEEILSYNVDIILYAWYGSGYDYQHVLPYMKSKCIKDKYIIKNNMITYGELYYENAIIYLKDPYLFILTSLDKASKAFNVINKGEFPHSIIHSWEDLNKILPNWVKIQKRMIEYKDDNKLNIYYKNIEIFENDRNYNTILENAIEYCKVDVLAMEKVWIKFKKLLEKNLNITVSVKTFTLSQLSMKIMESKLPKYVKLYVPTLEEYSKIRNAIYGGRVISKNGIYEENIVYADVVSLYPSAMKLLKHSYGKPKLVDYIDFEKHGIYRVTLLNKHDQEPKNYLNFVPRRINRKLTWEWFKIHEGWYHTYDLIIAKSEGFDIYCHEGFEYPEKDYIFNDFIDTLYSMKETHTACSCEEQPCPIRMVAKIALNGGGYGKFVQKPIDKEIYIVKRDVVAGECDKLQENENGEICIGKRLVKRPLFYNLDSENYDKMIIEKEDEPIYSTQCGISILSASRYRLYKLCKQFENIDIIYSDTDSIFVKQKSVDWELFKSKCGSELGQLDSTIDDTKNAIISKMYIGGAKMYAFEYLNNKNKLITKLHCKGVPNYMLSLNQFKYLMESPDNTIAYKFEIIRRKLVNVITKDLIKDIKQT